MDDCSEPSPRSDVYRWYRYSKDISEDKALKQLEEISNIIRVSELRSAWDAALHGSDEEVESQRTQFVAENLAYPMRKLWEEEEFKSIALKTQKVLDFT